MIFFGEPNKVKDYKNFAPLVFQDSEIKRKAKVKYIRIIFDEGMTWVNQAKEARKKSLSQPEQNAHIQIFILDRDTSKHLILNGLVFPHINDCLNT